MIAILRCSVIVLFKNCRRRRRILTSVQRENRKYASSLLQVTTTVSMVKLKNELETFWLSAKNFLTTLLSGLFCDFLKFNCNVFVSICVFTFFNNKTVLPSASFVSF